MPSSIKWIKISLSLFDNTKIKYIRTLPDGDRILLFWIYLLTRAGTCNSNGFVFITEGVPYSIDVLSKEVDIPASIVRFALELFQRLNMIESNSNGYILISGWADYQNTDALNKRRESDRIRQYAHREKLQLALPDVSRDSNVTPKNGGLQDLSSRDTNVTGNVTPDVTSRDNKGIPSLSRDDNVTRHVTVTPASLIRKKKEDNIDNKNGDINNNEVSLSNINKNNHNKSKYAELVSLTSNEYTRLVDRFGEKSTKDRIESLSLYKQSKGISYKSDYATILNWDRMDNERLQATKRLPIGETKKAGISSEHEQKLLKLSERINNK
jgi:predicted phage replisome organizer